MLLTLSLLVAAPAHAYRDQVLLYDGNSAPSDWGDGSLTDLDSALTAAGARSVDQASTWPSKLDNYVLVVLFLSQSSYSEAQRDDLQSVVDAGGGIVLVTDNDDFVPYTEGIFNSLLSYMGADSRFDDYQVIGNRTGDCSELSATIDNELTVGQPDLQYALGVQADPGGSGASVYGSGDFSLVVVEDRFVLIGDVNVMYGGCDGEIVDNSPFYANLFTWAYNGTCADTDNDGDGYEREQCGGDDCDDADPAVNPGTMRYPDEDGDGHGDPSRGTQACSAPADWIAVGDDCDDEDTSSYLGEGPLYVDDDGDGYGDPDGRSTACELTSGLSQNADDCDDADDAVHPDADEYCNNADDDCDGETDEDAVDATTWYHDGDDDGYGEEEDSRDECEAPENYVSKGGDCADGDPTTYPGTASYTEVCGDYLDDSAGGGADAPVDCGCPGTTAALLMAPLALLVRRRRSARR